MVNKLEEIRISCECVGGSILEAIPNIGLPGIYLVWKLPAEENPVAYVCITFVQSTSFDGFSQNPTLFANFC